jgi:hypothetical protein
VALTYDAAPLESRIVLSPQVDSVTGTLSGTGRIESPYSGAGADLPLTGKVKRGSVRWTINYGKDKLSFVGRERNNAWTGRVTGKIGPASVSRKVTIPLNDATVVRFHGKVSTSDGSATPTPAEGVLVTLQSDLNGNSTIDNGESATDTSDSDGLYDLSLPVVPNKKVTLDFTKTGYSKTPKMYSSVTLGSVIQLNTTLHKLDDLTVNAGSASSGNGTLNYGNLPAGVSAMRGRVFNPATDTPQFPGEFADDTGNMLVSSVFSAIEAEDTNGQPVHDLAQDTKMRMRVPEDSWGQMQDLFESTGKIDVPLYYYDEKDGQWKRSTSDGWLENEAGTVLPESKLASIRSKDFTGPLYAAGNVTHLSYWNVDWPISSHGCVQGKIVDASNNPVSGAVVTVRGLTYTGSSSPQTTDASGSFCVDVMRSEAAGEDLDGNGNTGEPSRVGISVYYNGKYYDLDAATVPQVAASCGTGGCADLGNLKLTAAAEIKTSLCTITGQVVYSGVAEGGDPAQMEGTPLPNLNIFAFDPDAEDALTACIVRNQGCSFFATSDENGNFTLKTVVLFGLELMTFSPNATGAPGTTIYFGNTSLTGCPTAPVTIKADALIVPSS